MKIECMMEQRVNKKFCVKLHKLPIETLDMLNTVHSESNMLKSNVFKWHKCFRECRDVTVDERSGAPVMKRMDENVMKIKELVQYDRQLTSRMIADEPDISKETSTKTLVQDLGMRNLAVKLMPRDLEEEQMDKHLTLWMDFAEQLQQDNSLLVRNMVLSARSHGLTSVHGMEIKERPQAKEVTDVKVQDENNVDLLS
jgi:hypothetical protein